MSLPLAPHKEQDGHAYVRVESNGVADNGKRIFFCEGMKGTDTFDGKTYPYDKAEHRLPEFIYDDDLSYQRIISSRRVEEGVETADYLALCLERGWAVECNSAGWMVSDENDPEQDPCAWGDTLRQAYHRFDAKMLEAEVAETYDSVDLEDRLAGYGETLYSGFRIGDAVAFHRPFAIRRGAGHVGVISGINPSTGEANITRPDGTVWCAPFTSLVPVDVEDIDAIMAGWPVSWE